MPRIVELAIAPDGASWPGLDLALVLHKLIEAGWAHWSERERAALASFGEAAWRERLTVDPMQTGQRASELLPFVVLVTDDLRALSILERDRSQTSWLQLAEMIDTHLQDLLQHSELHGLWTTLEARAPVTRWLVDPAREAAMTDAALAEDLLDEIARRLAAAADAWSWLGPASARGACRDTD